MGTTKRTKQFVEDVLSMSQELAGDATVPTLDAWSQDKLIMSLNIENEELKKENLQFKTDGMYKLYFALNRKSNEIADMLNEAVLSMNNDDKAFDRFLKLIEKMDHVTYSLDKLRNDYLKIDEDKAAEIETKGIPLIERRPQSKKAR